LELGSLKTTVVQTQIENRVNQTINKIYLLEKIGFNTKSIGTNTESLIFKAYIRPIIQYECDCLCLTKNDIINLNTLDNIIKTKLNLYLRLIENQFTLILIENLIEESNNNIINNSRNDIAYQYRPKWNGAII